MASNARSAYISLILILLAFTAYNWDMWLVTSSWIFQERDLNRAADLLRGHLIAYGPETTGGGHLFGPLYYFLLALPAAFGMPWKGGWYLMQMFTIGGGIFLWWFLRARVGLMAASFGVVFYLFSDWVRRLTRHFYNASFVTLFMVAATIFLLKTFADETSKRRSWFLFLLLVGLGCQLQASIFLLVLVGVALQALAPQLKLQRLDGRSFAFGFIGLLLPLLPFLVWKTTSLHFEDISPDGSTFDAFKAMSVIVQTSHEGITSLFLVFVGYLFVHTPLVWLGVGITSASLSNVTEKQKKILRVLLVQTVMMFPLIIYHTFASNAYRYIGPYVVGAVMLTAVFLEIGLRQTRRVPVFACWLMICGAVVFYFSDSQKKIISEITHEDPSDRSTPPGSNIVLATLGQKIFEQTGWDYAEARRRVFFVNMHVEQGWAYPYSAAMMSPRDPAATNIPDGYIASTDGPGNCEPETPEACRKWILQQEIPNDLRHWITDGAIKLKHPIALPYGIQWAFLIPYETVNLEKAPPFFQNIGYGYSKYPGSEIIEDRSAHVGAVRDTNGNFVFHWNDCPRRERGCSTGIVVNLKPSKKDRYQIHVQVLGQTLSHASEWFSPRWTEEWRQPYIELECHGRSEKIQIAESIGRSLQYTKKSRGNIVNQTNSILAPFERIFERDCVGGFSKITAGRAGSTVVDTNLLEPLKISAPALSMESRTL